MRLPSKYVMSVLPIKISGLAVSGIGSPFVVVHGNLFMFSAFLFLKFATFKSTLLLLLSF